MALFFTASDSLLRGDLKFSQAKATRYEHYDLSLPLWEVGLGLFSLRANHYRGSDQSDNYFFPFPFFIYRGKNLHVENSYVEGKMRLSNRLSLRLSMGAGLRVNSDKNRARSGMRNLPYSVEAGPMLEWKIIREKRRRHHLSFYFPVRALVSVDDFDWKHEGEFTVPFLSYSYVIGKKRHQVVNFTAAVMYASKGYHNYFYGVEEKYETATRPAYRAPGGYSGYHLTAYYGRNDHPLFSFLFARWDNLRDVSFENSPLFKKRDAVSVGVGFFYYFWSSKRKAQKGV